MNKPKTKLTPEMFAPYAVEFIDDLGGWKYLGNDCRELSHCAEIIRAACEILVLPWGAPVRLSRQTKLDRGTVLVAIALDQMTRFHLHGDKTWFRYPAEFPSVQPGQARAFSTNYNYTTQFDLTNRRRPPDRLCKIEYELTKFGQDFLNGKSPCPKFVFNIGKKVLKKSEEMVWIGDFFSATEFGALYEFPLWWESDENRKAILGDGYATVDWTRMPAIVCPKTTDGAPTVLTERVSKRAGTKAEKVKAEEVKAEEVKAEEEAERAQQEEARLMAELEAERERLDAEQTLSGVSPEIREKVTARLDTPSDYKIAADLSRAYPSLTIPIVKAIRVLARLDGR